MKKFEDGGQNTLKDGQGKESVGGINRGRSPKTRDEEVEYEIEQLPAENTSKNSYGTSKGGKAKPIPSIHSAHASPTRKRLTISACTAADEGRGIQSVFGGKYASSTPQQVAENALSRKFSTNAPNEKWVSDVTVFKYGNGQKAYLSAILDLHDINLSSPMY